LEKVGVDHALHDYEVDEAVGEGYGEAVAAAIGADETQVFKTLMAVVDGEHVVAIIPVTERLSMKQLAAAAGDAGLRWPPPATPSDSPDMFWVASARSVSDNGIARSSMRQQPCTL
jgi:prolyl-tRNA editing enzyme YbaK/EbsC (Cys-tRNA(Pro) deacylase)